MIKTKNKKTAQELIKELYDGKMAFGGGRIKGTSSCHLFISFDHEINGIQYLSKANIYIDEILHDEFTKSIGYAGSVDLRQCFIDAKNGEFYNRWGRLGDVPLILLYTLLIHVHNEDISAISLIKCKYNLFTILKKHTGVFRALKYSLPSNIKSKRSFLDIDITAQSISSFENVYDEYWKIETENGWYSSNIDSHNWRVKC